jgi:hypothetical protein
MATARWGTYGKRPGLAWGQSAGVSRGEIAALEFVKQGAYLKKIRRKSISIDDLFFVKCEPGALVELSSANNASFFRLFFIFAI